jgi:hypothetical protein
MSNARHQLVFWVLLLWGLGAAYQLDVLRARLDALQKRVDAMSVLPTSRTYFYDPDDVVAGGMTVYINGKPYLPLLVPAKVTVWGTND